MVDTLNSYEFSMQALLINNEWYALVEDADPSRIMDIDEVIKEEFDAKVKGWCVLKEQQKKLGTALLPFAAGKNTTKAIVYRTKSNSYWLLKLQPNPKSRLRNFKS